MRGPWYSRMIFESRTGSAMFFGAIGLLVGVLVTYSEGATIARSLITGVIAMLVSGALGMIICHMRLSQTR